MDDLKLLKKPHKLGIKQCGVITLKIGKLVKTERITLPDRKVIKKKMMLHINT